MAIGELPTPTTNTAQAERHLVAFCLGDEVYGVDIAHIHAIINPQPVTFVPRTPPFVKGVMNLRGRVIPIIDLRIRFGMEPRPESMLKGSRIMIVDVEDVTAGLIVDSVSEVIRIPAASIDPLTQLVSSVESDCISGIGKVKGVDGGVDRLIVILDIYKTLVTCSNDADMLKKLQD